MADIVEELRTEAAQWNPDSITGQRFISLFNRAADEIEHERRNYRRMHKLALQTAAQHDDLAARLDAVREEYLCWDGADKTGAQVADAMYAALDGPTT